MKLSVSAILLLSALGVFVNARRLPTVNELVVRQYCYDCCDDDSCCDDKEGAWEKSYCEGVSCGESLTMTWAERGRLLLM